MQAAATPEEAARLLDRMTVMCDEGSSLMIVLLMANVKVWGPLSWPARPFIVPPEVWHRVMVRPYGLYRLGLGFEP